MEFKYHSGTSNAIEQIFGTVRDFEKQLDKACAPDVTEVHIRPLEPGLSGADVFRVQCEAPDFDFIPWVVKACADEGLIENERANYKKYVEGKLSRVPRMLPLSSKNLLLFDFGGDLVEFDPHTLRTGYVKSSAQALSRLMNRIVRALKPIHRFKKVAESFVNRIERKLPINLLDEKLAEFALHLPADLASRLSTLWRETLDQKGRFPCLCSGAHGDLNAGNVLFEPGQDASYPIFIDFASMARSKDIDGYPDGYHLPFWDFAKLERDLQTRLFLSEALDTNLVTDVIVRSIRWANGGRDNDPAPDAPCFLKLARILHSLRSTIKGVFPSEYQGCYRVSLAYAMLTVLFRQHPDTDSPPGLQHRVAAEAAAALLAEPFNVPPDLIPLTSPLTTSDFFSLGHVQTSFYVRDGDGIGTYPHDGIKCLFSKPTPLPTDNAQSWDKWANEAAPILPDDIQDRVTEIQDAKARGEHSMFNGYSVGLESLTVGRSDMEQLDLSLVFRPNRYYACLATSRQLDKARPGRGTLREEFLDGNPDAFEFPVSILANNFGVVLTVFDCNGRVFLSKRSIKVAVRPGELDTSVVEGVKAIDDLSNDGQLDLYKAAIRGAREELSADLRKENVHFLGIGVDMYYYQWNIFGVSTLVEEGTKVLKNLKRGSPGKWENEAVVLHDSSPEVLVSFLNTHTLWAPGLVGLYWALIHRYGRDKVDQAFVDYRPAQLSAGLSYLNS